MTESFIMNAFHKMGEQPQTVKVMRNRYTGEPAGYCFVHFPTDEMALDAMHKLNGKVIPGSNPVSIIHEVLQIHICIREIIVISLIIVITINILTRLFGKKAILCSSQLSADFITIASLMEQKIFFIQKTSIKRTYF